MTYVNENLLMMLHTEKDNPFQSAVLLDEQGREIPITEEMIMHACNELLKQWQFPGQAAA